MTVSNKTIINKMMEQLRAAKECENDSVMINHIAKVKLLSDLLLDEYEEKVEGGEHKIVTPHKASSNEIDKAETSIFDF